jgi:hypothetical protein
MRERQIVAAEAALRLGMSRERLVRTIQRRELAGELRGGKWVVFERSIQEYLSNPDLKPAA